MNLDKETAYRIPAKPDRCRLCERAMTQLTRHHLIPRMRHRKKRAQKHFAVADMRTRILWVCRPCHNHIHDMLTEKELEAEYHTREALLSHPEINRFVNWIRGRPAGFKPASRSRRRA